jgi:RNA polymerase sigma-70 factor (ECF subfamily)
VEDPEGAFASGLRTYPEQHGRLEFEDFRAVLAKLRPDQREALLLVGAEGLSYDEAAVICGVAVGTIKSRVNRARLRLQELLHREADDNTGPDKLTLAAV